jgi:hypothetical protein
MNMFRIEMRAEGGLSTDCAPAMTNRRTCVWALRAHNHPVQGTWQNDLGKSIEMSSAEPAMPRISRPREMK